MKMKEMCIEERSDSKIVCSENNRKIIFNNPSRNTVKKIKVDGCQITTGIRCDFLVIETNKNEHFIELKGQNIKHAFEQLKRSIQLLSESDKKTCYVICSKSPLTSAQIQNEMLNFRKLHNSKLVVRSGSFEVDI
ncbi:hypothetical protein QQ008_00545 [Fulvivirgaceae bacterium BMA10]|uniref:Uncharacterized protein n=1 Tax=Splendidivirga corallicola TaxID=3051826 RepID=A0ABT8KIE9_9BACT|nr:hypothetical protein [Fulvivirgaceae bacterium BMA10]